MPKNIPEYLRLLQKGAYPEYEVPSSNEIPEPTGDYKKIQEYGKGVPKDAYKSDSLEDDMKAMTVFKKYNPNQQSLNSILENKKREQEEDANFQESLKEFQKETRGNDGILPKLRKLMVK